MKSLLLGLVFAVAACAPNYLDGKDYSYLEGLRCQPDGSLILAQRANLQGKYAPPRSTETAANCTIALDPEWELLRQVKIFEKERQAGRRFDVISKARPK